MESDVTDADGFGLPEVVEAGIASITDRLARGFSVKCDMTVQHRQEAGSIGRVASFHDDVEDEPASAAREVQFVPILHAAPALYDDVGMRFEQAHQLLAGRNGLPIDHTASGLVDDALDQREIVFGLKPPERRFSGDVCLMHSTTARRMAATHVSVAAIRSR